MIPGMLLMCQVVSCHRTPDGVYLVDVKKAVIRNYGGQKSSQMMKISGPAGLAVDKHGNILVADDSNNRLFVIDRSLCSAHEMSVSVDEGLNDPFSLWYDKSRNRLFIGEWLGSRVIVIDHLRTSLHLMSNFPNNRSRGFEPVC